MTSVRLALTAVRSWDRTRWAVVAVASAVTAVALGVPTVMIPNGVFTREIPVVWWNYPVWLVTSVLAGALVATYWRGPRARVADDEGGPGAEGSADRPGRLGLAGGVLSWFAIGCPVCNKIALLALGYSGALTWFAPVQPFLGLVALVLTAVALVVRLRGEVACPLPKVALTGA